MPVQDGRRWCEVRLGGKRGRCSTLAVAAAHGDDAAATMGPGAVGAASGMAERRTHMGLRSGQLAAHRHS